MRKILSVALFTLFLPMWVYADLSGYYVEQPNPERGWELTEPATVFGDMVLVGDKLYVGFGNGNKHIFFGPAGDNFYLGKYIGDFSDHDWDKGYPILLQSDGSSIKIYYFAGPLGAGRIGRISYDTSTGNLTQEFLGTLPDRELGNMRFLAKGDDVYLFYFKRPMGILYRYGSCNSSTLLFELKIDDYMSDKVISDFREFNGVFYVAIFIGNASSGRGKLYLVRIRESSGSFLSQVETVSDDVCQGEDNCPKFLRLSFDPQGHLGIAVLYRYNNVYSYNDYLRFYFKSSSNWTYREVETNVKNENILESYYYDSSWYVALQGSNNTGSYLQIWKFDGSSISKIFEEKVDGKIAGARFINGKLYLLYNNKIYVWNSNNFALLYDLTWSLKSGSSRVVGFRDPDGEIHLVKAVLDSDNNKVYLYEITDLDKGKFFKLERIGKVPYYCKNSSGWCNYLCSYFHYQLLFNGSTEYLIVADMPSFFSNNPCSQKRAFIFRKDVSGWHLLNGDISLSVFDALNDQGNIPYVKQFADFHSGKIEIYGVSRSYDDQTNKYYNSILKLTFDPISNSTSGPQSIFSTKANFITDGAVYAVEDGVLSVVHKDDNNINHLAVYVDDEWKDIRIQSNSLPNRLLLRKMGSKIYIAASSSDTGADSFRFYIIDSNDVYEYPLEFCSDNSYTCEESNCNDHKDNDKDGLVDELVYSGSCSRMSKIIDPEDIFVLNGTIIVGTDWYVYYLSSGKFYRITGIGGHLITDRGILSTYGKTKYYPLTNSKWPHVWLGFNDMYFGTVNLDEYVYDVKSIRGYCVYPMKAYYNFSCSIGRSIVECELTDGDTQDFELIDASSFYFHPKTEGVKEAMVSCTLPDSSVFTVRLRGRTPGASAAPSRILTVSITGSGSGRVTSNPSGINCDSGVCSATFESGTLVTLTATAGGNSAFSGWGGDCAGCGSSSRCSVFMYSNKICRATFIASQGWGTAVEPPTHRIVGLADPQSGPVRFENGKVDVNLSYTAPVDALVGWLSEDFRTVLWLDPATCHFGIRFSYLSREKTLICSSVSPPSDGYVFWLVSGVPFARINFKSDPYELRFFHVKAE